MCVCVRGKHERLYHRCAISAARTTNRGSARVAGKGLGGTRRVERSRFARVSLQHVQIFRLLLVPAFSPFSSLSLPLVRRTRRIRGPPPDEGGATWIRTSLPLLLPPHRKGGQLAAGGGTISSPCMFGPPGTEHQGLKPSFSLLNSWYPTNGRNGSGGSARNTSPQCRPANPPEQRSGGQQRQGRPPGGTRGR